MSVLKRLAGTVVSAAVAAGTARAAYKLLRDNPPGGAELWNRKNHRGEELTLLLGPAAVAGAAAANAVAPGLTTRERVAGIVATVGAGALGAYDDLAGDAKAKGFRGHLTALSEGQVTSGLVKIAGIGLTGIAVAAILKRGNVIQTVADGALIAAAANVANLFDLRPGRTLKVVLAQTPFTAVAGPMLAAPVGSAAGVIDEDLGESGMLGDCGANALGAAVGTAVVASAPRGVRWAVLAGLVGLTAASEKISFTKVIAGNELLDKLDQLGRRSTP